MPLKASALIIGNEILNGKVQDANSIALARVLFECGITLKRIETIPDHTETIISALQKQAADFDLVFTSGGIGPTHDDITYDAVAKAFGQELKLHPATIDRYAHLNGHPMNEARQKMARLPEGAEVLWTDNLWVPLVFLKPVYVLPGIPELFIKMLEGVKHRFSYKPFERALVYSHKPEGDLAFALEQVQKAFPNVDIGSYPQKIGSEYRLMLSIEGIEAREVQQAANEIEKFA